MGGGREAGLFGETTRARGVNRECGNRQRSKAEGALWPLILQTGHLSPKPASGARGRTRQESDSRGYVRWPHPAQRGCGGIEHSRVEGQPDALRTTVAQNLICARWPSSAVRGQWSVVPLQLSAFPISAFRHGAALFPFVLEPVWDTIRGGRAAHPRFRAMPAFAATLVGQQKRMRICLQARSTR